MAPSLKTHIDTQGVYFTTQDLSSNIFAICFTRILECNIHFSRIKIHLFQQQEKVPDFALAEVRASPMLFPPGGPAETLCVGTQARPRELRSGDMQNSRVNSD